MDALISKKTSLLSRNEKLIAEEQKIRSQMGYVMSQLSGIEELISAQSALDEKVSALISSAPPKAQKKRGPKKLSEMTPEELAKHNEVVAARAASRAASRAGTSSASSVTGSDSEEKKKKVYKSWIPWALENDFKTDDHFYVSYKGLTTTLSGLWEDNVYYLCSPLIAPAPKDMPTEQATRLGYGVPIKRDSPTMAAMLVKAALGCTSIDKKGFGPGASPSDIKIRIGEKLVGVYDLKTPEVVVA